VRSSTTRGSRAAAEAVDHARNLGYAASQRDRAHKNDYTAANGFAGMGAQDRGTQVDAMGLAQQTANGTNLQSMQLGQQMLDQGVQAQQAAAASSRGGALAQAAARSQQANGQGSFVAQGNTQLQAQRANEMAAGRDAYMGQASALRASDAQGQSLQQQQALAQQQQELQQRQQNQQTQMAYETQGQNVNNAAADAALSRDEIAHGYDATQTARQTQMANRQAQTVAAGVNAGGALVAKGGDAIFGGSPTTQPQQTYGDYKDPYSEQVSGSDERMKQNVRSLAAAVAARKAVW
jgi:hypothetical protein